MSTGTSLLFPEEGEKEEICNGYVPDNDSSTDRVKYVVSRMLELGEQYARNIQAATKDLTNSVYRNKITSAEDEFFLGILEVAEEVDTDRQRIVDEVQIFNVGWHGKVIAEIKEIEASLEIEERNLEELIEGHTVDIPQLMRAHSAHNEMKAYLRGLKFRAGDTTD